MPIVYLSKLGHSIGYEKVVAIETIQAELTLKLKKSLNFPLVSKYGQGKVS